MRDDQTTQVPIKRLLIGLNKLFEVQHHFCAFAVCAGLTSVTIGNGVTSIGGGAFMDCLNLVSIKFDGTIAQWEAISLESEWYTNIPATEVVCSDGTVKI